MKTYITSILLLLAMSIGQAQEGYEKRKEKIKAFKIAYLTERLELTAKEAQVFWPIYNQFEQAMDDIYQSERKVLKNRNQDFAGIDEATAKTMVENHQSFEKQKQQAKNTLLELLKDKFSYKKTLILIKAEGDFRRDLLKKLRSKKDGRHKGPKR